MNSANPPPATGVEAHERMATAMYPTPTPAPVDIAPNADVQAVRDANPARRLYSDEKQFGRDGGAVRELAIALDPAGNEASLQAKQRTFASMAVDIGMDRSDVAQMAALVRKLTEKPPTDEERASAQRGAIRDLRVQYGKRFDQVLQDTKRLVQRDPRLAALMNTSALGDHPTVIARMAQLAERARARGELK